MALARNPHQLDPLFTFTPRLSGDGPLTPQDFVCYENGATICGRVDGVLICGAMRCPKCSCQDDKVIDSRSSREGATIRRRRECIGCGHRYTTYEEIEKPRLMVL